MAEAAALKAGGTPKAGAVVAVPPSDGATPYLVAQGAADAIAWYRRVFGAELVTKMDGPDGKVMHSELKVGPARFMLTEERAEFGSRGPKAIGGSATTVIIFVPDADATIKAAVDAGATIGMPVADQFWGDRSGTITDPFGHQWFISTHKEDLTPAQIQERAKAMFAAGGAGC
ncbi:VOC family protein [Pseudaquabacterium terrae]|nr:VOC family protein [Aquabacterium terrae]